MRKNSTRTKEIIAQVKQLQDSGNPQHLDIPAMMNEAGDLCTHKNKVDQPEQNVPDVDIWYCPDCRTYIQFHKEK